LRAVSPCVLHAMACVCFYMTKRVRRCQAKARGSKGSSGALSHLLPPSERWTACEPRSSPGSSSRRPRSQLPRAPPTTNRCRSGKLLERIDPLRRRIYPFEHGASAAPRTLGHSERDRDTWESAPICLQIRAGRKAYAPRDDSEGVSRCSDRNANELRGRRSRGTLIVSGRALLDRKRVFSSRDHLTSLLTWSLPGSSKRASKAALAGNDHVDLCSALYIGSRLKRQRAAISAHDAQRCEAELPARRLVRRSNRADA
jgi:hypothetical protein